MPVRPEITSKKIADGERREAVRRVQDRHGNDVDDEVDAYSIKEFCRRHGISESFYFKLKKQGLGPREMEAGTRKLISKEAAADWRSKREAAAADD